MPIEIAAPPIAEHSVSPRRKTLRPSVQRGLLCVVLAVVAVLVHGYHPFAVDGSIYVPAIKKQLNPELYPHNAEFFLFPARLSVFASLVADSVRVTHIPLEYMLLLWHLATIALFFAACWKLCRLCFPRQWDSLYGALLMAALLTIPVAGTSLMVSDPYLTSRSFSTPALLVAICCVLERKVLRAALWIVAAALVHPLMAAFGAVFATVLYAIQNRGWRLLALTGAGCMAVVTVGVAWAHNAVVTPDYRAAVLTRSYFFLSQWTWYEIVGLIAPLVLFGVHLWYRREDADRRLSDCLSAALLFGVFFLLVGIIISGTPSVIAIAKFQPLRAFHLLYILLFLLPVNAFLMKVTARRIVPAAALLVAVTALMFFVQMRTFPASAHIEWPWLHVDNQWVQAFDWVKDHTPTNAVFALQGDYTDAPGEDCQGFNARAERSSLPDVSKDGGVAALFPNIATDWARKTQATAVISRLRQAGEMKDVQQLVDAGASWVLLQRPQAAQLDCPYENATVAVCRLGNSDSLTPVARVKVLRPSGLLPLSATGNNH